MVLDGASSHRAKELLVPDNIVLLPLPAYSPELNPQEHIWDEIREKELPNRVFDSLEGVKRQLRSGLGRLKRDGARIKSITHWPWIVTLNLNAR
jgi:transposase